MLVACNKDQNMDAAVQSLKDYYKHLLPSTDNSTPITSESFTVIRSFSSQGKQYSVSWKTDSDVITVVDYEGNEDGYNNENAATVRVPSNLSANVSYKLTATITAPDGKTTANVEFNLLATYGSASTPSDGVNTGGSGSNMTISEVLASAEGTVVKFTGTVHSFYEEWSSYGNCSPYIVDGNGNKILVFKTTTRVTIGDVVTVEGTVDLFNSVPQIAKDGSKVTIDVPHVCSSWTAATCGKDSACVVCGAAGADKATGNHTYVDGLCSVCGISEASMKVLGTLSFSSTSNRTSWDTSKQIWAANGITLTNNKGSSTSNVADYSNPARFYKSSQLIVAATGMLKIEFTCNSAAYAMALQSSITSDDGGKVFVTGSTVTVTFANPVDSYTIASLTGGQVRVNSITVYVAE